MSFCKDNVKAKIFNDYMPKDKEIEKLKNFYYLFADTTRLKILISLSIMPLCVGDLSNLLNINQSTLSHQLQLLRNLNLVEAKRDKKNMTYSIASEYVEKMIECCVDAVN